MKDADTSKEPGRPGPGFLPALTFIDAAGFHGIATTLIAVGPGITRNWAALIGNARIAAAVTTWPDELRPAAERFTGAADKLVAILDQRDSTPVAEPAKELDAASLALSNAGWAYLKSPAGIPAANQDDERSLEPLPDDGRRDQDAASPTPRMSPISPAEPPHPVGAD